MNNKKINFINSGITTENSDNEKMIVGGFICHYNKPNLNGEVDLSGCFDEFLNDWNEKKIPLPLVLNHNETSSETIGLFFDLKNSDEGIYGRAEIIDTPYIRSEIWPKIKAGVWPYFSTGGFSFDFDTENNLWKNKKGYLTHVALVSIGADENANMEILNSLNKNFHNQALKLNLFDINLLNQ